MNPSERLSDEQNTHLRIDSPFRSGEALQAEASSSSAFSNMYQNWFIWISNRAEQTLQAARSALLRAQKDTQEAFMRYTSYREAEQAARLAVTNAEKRRDDISEQWRTLFTMPLTYFLQWLSF